MLAGLRVYWNKSATWASFLSVVAMQIAILAAVVGRVDYRLSAYDGQLTLVKIQLNDVATDLRNLSERIDRLDTPLSKKEERDVKRIDDRMDRIVQALDTIYDQMTQHIRNHK